MYPYGFPTAPIPVLATLLFEGDSQMLLGSDVSASWTAAADSSMTLSAEVLFFGPPPGMASLMAEAVVVPTVEPLLFDSDGRLLDPDFTPGCD